MSRKKIIEELQAENENFLLEQNRLKAELGELKNVLASLDEYRVLKEFKGDLLVKANCLRDTVRKEVDALKVEVFGL